jgi:hypothetical protein
MENITISGVLSKITLGKEGITLTLSNMQSEARLSDMNRVLSRWFDITLPMAEPVDVEIEVTDESA